MTKTNLAAFLCFLIFSACHLFGCSTSSQHYYPEPTTTLPEPASCEKILRPPVTTDASLAKPSLYFDYLYCLSSPGSLEDFTQYAQTYARLSNQGLVQSDFPIHANDTVKKFVQYFKERKNFTGSALTRSQLYLPRMREIFRENDLPEDLAYLSLIESGFNPHAYSPAGACGLWQFMKATGQRYGLRVDGCVDERRDPEKATQAAVKYLKDLYAMFNDWNLAVAAYNAGEQKILNVSKQYQTTDFWKMRDQCYLRQETCDFVPKLMAAILIAKNPEAYGFHNPPAPKTIPLTAVNIPRPTQLKQIAIMAGITLTELQQYNPELRTASTPAQKGGYWIKIPEAQKQLFAQNYERNKNSLASSSTNSTSYKSHRIRPGETLYDIARHYKTKVNYIQKANGIRDPRLIHPGHVLKIPVPVVVSSS